MEIFRNIFSFILSLKISTSSSNEPPSRNIALLNNGINSGAISFKFLVRPSLSDKPSIFSAAIFITSTIPLAFVPIIPPDAPSRTASN